ncbi:MAG TPA: class I SAM-dependent methyltransferase [Pyrinomonadaceae bacterium]|jgi:tocopherol O-methyltransferase
MRHNKLDKIREHYDVASPYYTKLWGQHLHHGYYETGRESKEEAAENLIKLLVARSGLSHGSRVLDVGCGVGGTSIWLAKNLDCRVTGVSLSPVQIQMATEAAASMTNKPAFLVDDANQLTVEGSYDIVWTVEVLSHLSRRGDFFRKAAGLLVNGGKICEAAWLKDEHLSEKDEEKYIRPIEKGMLVELPSLAEYRRHMDDNGLRLLHYEDISRNVAATWDVCLSMMKEKALWELAARHGREFVAFLKSFRAMREGFKSGAFRYALMVSEKP